ncbi:anti-sigma regulatory factor (Ser/Thr protein kinase) [Actinoplanes octamycinicus]|uniref:Anti-sigma regulatory factor (Ser/Thr protein kinase) n=1 Tax=Actinoplanes octamycinicus TaxID=135948 RepID=A0A7W7H5G1_9ACTN|nr:ATP-binding protein [Actinoplanes octamycinicus]MBB4743992.1 anti-sigma regulatory factor (Ser/Thr protein kinase) [Actinoplanes octamycinicus]GIE58616.1 hypothetical protein Aoc01nite_40180 [Actinoplanes octamycinicus]
MSTDVGTSTRPRLLLTCSFTAATVTGVRHALRTHVTATGVDEDTAFDFVTAVHELVTNAVRHGGGHGQLELSIDCGQLICTVSDYGTGSGTLPVCPPPGDQPGGRGLFLARQLTGALLIDQRGAGLTATVTIALPPTR